MTTDPAGASTPTVGHRPTDDALDRTWARPPGLLGRARTVQNDIIGMRLIFTGLFFLLLGGSVDSVVMRLLRSPARWRCRSSRLSRG